MVRGKMQAQTMTFYETSIGKKIIMAATGVVTFGFVVVHLLGNLQIFLGPEKLNRYSEFLHGMGGFLWLFRLVMVVSIVAHIVASTQLTLQNRAARPIGYKMSKFRDTSYAARTMWVGGPILALFIAYHLLHLTLGTVHPDFTDNVYNNVVFGFQSPIVSSVYIGAMILLGFHLSHGVWSMFQSVGLHPVNWYRRRKALAYSVGIGIAAMNISIPVSVLCGFIRPV
jgi:succinate dehydrogenase / fumarate reductase cytochrome b subunit